MKKELLIGSNADGVVVFKNDNTISVLDEMSILHTYKDIETYNYTIGCQIKSGEFLGKVDSGKLNYSVKRIKGLTPIDTEWNLSEKNDCETKEESSTFDESSDVTYILSKSVIEFKSTGIYQTTTLVLRTQNEQELISFLRKNKGEYYLLVTLGSDIVKDFKVENGKIID